MDALIETLKNLGSTRLMMMAATLLSLIVFFVFITVRSSSPNMDLLYSDLTTSDSTAIVSRLDLAGIDYQLTDNGASVNVDRGDVARARMILAEEGLPGNASMGYELFDEQQSFGTTSFVQNVNQLRALQGELARTISTLDTVKSARVHIVLPERELFSRESQPATASVFLDVRRSAEVGGEQILAIQQLVASSVPQLNAKRVTVVDAEGNLLARGDGDDTAAVSADSSETVRLKFEGRLKREIEDMVSRVVGPDRVRAIVSADLDFNVVTRNSETYDPEGQVVRSTQTISEESFDNEARNGDDQAVTVENNLPGLPNPQNAQGGSADSPLSGNNRSEEVVNFEISRTVENVIQESGEINKLSVAVLVDGRYEEIPTSGEGTATEEGILGSGEETEFRYIPRSEAELQQIRTLVQSAMGFDDVRGDSLEVVNMQFARDELITGFPEEETVLGIPREEVAQIAETLILSLVAILVILLVLRPLVGHVAAAAQATADAKIAAVENEAKMLAAAADQAALPGPDGMMPQSELEATLDMNNVEGQVKQSSIKKINELVDNHPQETVSVLRNWMAQEN